MAKRTGLTRQVTISLQQKHGPMASYWSAVVRRSRKGPVLFENMDAARAIALAGAENWARRQGFQYKIREA